MAMRERSWLALMMICFFKRAGEGSPVRADGQGRRRCRRRGGWGGGAGRASSLRRAGRGRGGDGRGAHVRARRRPEGPGRGPEGDGAEKGQQKGHRAAPAHRRAGCSRRGPARRARRAVRGGSRGVPGRSAGRCRLAEGKVPSPHGQAAGPGVQNRRETGDLHRPRRTERTPSRNRFRPVRRRHSELSGKSAGGRARARAVGEHRHRYPVLGDACSR